MKNQRKTLIIGVAIMVGVTLAVTSCRDVFGQCDPLTGICQLPPRVQAYANVPGFGMATQQPVFFGAYSMADSQPTPAFQLTPTATAVATTSTACNCVGIVGACNCAAQLGSCSCGVSQSYRSHAVARSRGGGYSAMACARSRGGSCGSRIFGRLRRR